MTYQPIRTAEQITVPVRSLNYRVYRWGNPEGDPVFMLHGWGDTGMSFQFVADAMAGDWCLIAPDWRGFGDSDWNPQGYWIPDYLADLDCLIRYFYPQGNVRLVGHSMGANVAAIYAGVHPERILHLVCLDQYGLPDADPATAPERLGKWLREWHDSPRNREYGDISLMIEQIKSLAAYLSDTRAAWLAQHWCTGVADGKVVSKIDPGHKRVNPVLYRREEARACWRRITARALLVLGTESGLLKRDTGERLKEDFKACFRQIEEIKIGDCGHMIHLDRPKHLAQILDEFLKT